MTKFLLITESNKPMMFNVMACAELYKTIHGGTISMLRDGEFFTFIQK